MFREPTFVFVLLPYRQVNKWVNFTNSSQNEVPIVVIKIAQQIIQQLATQNIRPTSMTIRWASFNVFYLPFLIDATGDTLQHASVSAFKQGMAWI